MELIFGIISIVSLFITTVMLCRIFKPGNVVEWVIFLFLTATGLVIMGAVILSAFNVLGSIYSWTAFTLSVGFILVLVLLLSSHLRRRCLARITGSEKSVAIKKFFRGLTPFEKIIIIPLLIALAITGLFNAGVVIFTAPAHWDSMVFHLSRMAYWLQHNNFNYYDATTFSQVTDPKIKSLLSLYLFLASGRNENLTQLVQFISYWIAVFSVYGISRCLKLKPVAALFAALIFSLLTECLMEATTPQSDMLLTAYLGCAVYALLAFHSSRRKKYLVAAGTGIGLAVATKSPALLAFPGLLVMAIYSIFAYREPVRSGIKSGALLILATIMAIAIFAGPTGYWSNYRLFGHPIGPKTVRVYHSFEGRSPGYTVRNGTKNLLRYIYDFIALDGLPPVSPVLKAQSWLKSVPESVFNLAGIKLEAEEGDGVREGPFIYNKPPYSHTDYSYWGILGFSLIWPAVILVLFGFSHSTPARLLSLGAVLFLLGQAYSGDYEPNRGRYFIEAAVFAAPVTGYLFLSRNKILRGYLVVIVGLGCLSALTAVIFRHRSPLVGRESVFLKSRLEQMLRDGPIFREPIRRFEELVPPSAVVAACLNPNSFEYPLFGEGLTRTVIPLNSFWKGLQPVPATAEYLLWCDDFDDVYNRRETDIHLGKDWYLRRLK